VIDRTGDDILEWVDLEPQGSLTHVVQDQLTDFYRRWNAAFDERDATAFVALYAPDARLMAPGVAPLLGRDAIRTYIETSFFSVGRVGSEMTSAAVVETSDHVVDIGTYALTFEGGLRTTGNYVTMFRRSSDGGLEACYDIFSPIDSPG
jgi:uncharacterized protein (TIGR02246 family)